MKNGVIFRICRIFIAALLTAFCLATISSTTLAQPANDTYDGRTVLTSTTLPFSTVVDTTEATSDSNDEEVNSQCGAPATDASVWYELAATSDGQVTVDLRQSNYSAGVIIATGSPGNFVTIACGPGTVDFQAVAGGMYAILVFDDQLDSAGNGGELRISISAVAGPTELLARLRALPGVASASLAPSIIPGTFAFRIWFEQPVDHNHPDGPRFLQRATLLHRSESAVTVLGLNGYYLPPLRQSELTYLLEANQLEVEHRFFTPSTPSGQDWQYLTIAQSAADHHRIVESFKNLYPGKWVSTGRSKGGMAAVYHRFFYPSDVDATVPYVAPSSHGTRDVRYVQFVDRLGTAECRERLQTFQRTALARRAEILALLPTDVFSILGADRALEFAIVETPFAFWQYSRFNSCEAIPEPNATTTELLDFLNYVPGLSFSYTDAGLNAYAAYYYQAATELGGPRFDERGLHGLLNYPRDDIPENYPPVGVEKEFDRALMERIELWIQTSGQRILFIYGLNDPWSASAFDVHSQNDSYRLFVMGEAGDHLAGIFDLSDESFFFVADTLNRWLLEAPVSREIQRAKKSGKKFDPPTRAELFMR